jgi:hypothetical protein
MATSRQWALRDRLTGPAGFNLPQKICSAGNPVTAMFMKKSNSSKQVVFQVLREDAQPANFFMIPL